MKCNVSGIERIIRIIAGILLLILGIKIVANTLLKIILIIISISILFSAISGFCFLYKIFGISTCKIKE